MWSGPRNISTAMMRSFEARGDCSVSDEPFYAWYLANSDVQHPMHGAVLASQPTSWEGVVENLLQASERPFFYQKHMAHHMVGNEDYSWVSQIHHAFLVRNPAMMIASYQRKRETVEAADLGLARQRQLHQLIVDTTGQSPPIIDAADVLANPAALLSRLCAALDLPYTDAMLKWQPGIRPTDGVWAPHWYNVVAETTGFEPGVSSAAKLDSAGRQVLAECESDYDFFYSRRLRIADL